MQKADLDAATKLFEKACAGGGNEDDWNTRLKDFLKKALDQHQKRLKQLSDGGRPQTALDREALRARRSLLEVVEERLDERLREFDEEVAQAAKELWAAQARIFEEALAGFGVASPVAVERFGPGASVLDDDAEISVPAPGGSAAFAAAFRSRDATGGVSPSSGYAATPGTGHFAEMHISRREEYDGIMLQSEANSEKDAMSVATATTIKPPLTPSMRGGPATLGAGPQETMLGSSQRVNSESYSSLHRKILTVKGGEKSGGPAAACTRPGKELSLRQLRDIIFSVYASKAQYDAKCQQTGEPTETMEHHLYGFLGKRYGLKSVIQEWASAIFRAIQKYAPRESDVAVFGKILRNTLAESFPSVQETLKQTVQQLLRQQLEDRYPHRPQSEIEALWRARSRCGVPLAECKEVVKYMYNAEDSQEIMLRLEASSRNPSADTEPLSPDSIRMRDLTQVLLNFQMHLTEGFLADFILIFRQIDPNNDGVLTAAQIEELVRRLGYVQAVDEGSPARTVLLEAQAATLGNAKKFKKGATFSQCVDLFTPLVSARWNAVSPPQPQSPASPRSSW